MNLIITTDPDFWHIDQDQFLAGASQLKPGSRGLCPNCSHTRKKSSNKSLKTWAVGDGTTFSCSHCGIGGLMTTSNKDSHQPRTIYRLDDITDQAIQYFANRGISEQTVRSNNIGLHNNSIVLPYYDEGKVVAKKIRSMADKKMWQEEYSAQIFFGLDDVFRDGKPIKEYVIITEGELDKMAWNEVGEWSAMSVPLGAARTEDQGDKIDACLRHAGEMLAEVKKFYIATDNDEAGRMLGNALAKHLGRHKCFMVEYIVGCKDSNDVLMKHGAKALKGIFKDAIPYPVEDIVSFISERDELINLYDMGFPDIDGLGFSEDFDRLMKFVEGQLFISTGVPGHGKTSFALFLMVRLAVQRGWTFAIYSPEQRTPKMVAGRKLPRTALIFRQLAEILIGKPMLGKGKMSKLEFNAAIIFLNKHFQVIEPKEGSDTLDGLLESVDYLYLRDGIQGVMIDPWNRIEVSKDRGETLHEYIGKALKKINRFKEDRSLNFFLTAHPTKGVGTKAVEVDGENIIVPNVPNLYHISGSADFFNMTDYGVCVYRDNIRRTVEIHVEKVKFDLFGVAGQVILRYDVASKRYHDTGKASTEAWIDVSKYKDEIARVAMSKLVVDSDDLPF